MREKLPYGPTPRRKGRSRPRRTRGLSPEEPFDLPIAPARNPSPDSTSQPREDLAVVSAKRAGEDGELHAVLRHGAPGVVDGALFEPLADLGVGERLAFVLADCLHDVL